MARRIRALIPLLLVLALAGCGDSDAPVTATTQPAPSGDSGDVDASAQRFPDVIDVAVRPGDGTYRFDVTISSPYDTAERYADAWRVVDPNGTVLGVRELLHDHASEQPFTRSLGGVVIPAGVDVVVVEARDSVNGWGGASLEVAVPGTGGG